METALMVLDRVLLIFIFAELLNTIGIIVREREILAEPFVLIGLIAVVRRILLVTAESERAMTPEELILEPRNRTRGVDSARDLTRPTALYFTRRLERRDGGDVDR